jgi:RNA-directed DNA polymerase
MTDNKELQQRTRAGYRESINAMGKKEFTLLKMQEYGFWPKNLPTPYERQKNETPEQYEARQALLKKYAKVIEDITKLYEEKDEINKKLYALRSEYDETWDVDKIRLDISKKIMEESKVRRAERKKQRELEKVQRSEAWQQKKSEEILFIGKGYSGLMQDRESDENKLSAQNLPLIKTDKELAELLCLEYKQLRFLVYHRDVVTVDHYHRYSVPKRKGGSRNIAAPKPILKTAQRRILEEILSKLTVSEHAHGFLKGKSVVSAAQEHIGQPSLVINMDLEDFFPTITFERVRGMFKALGYSSYIASLLSMICTYCERMPIEVRGKIKYVKTSPRILPQGSPASPMITNILCGKLDKRLSGLAEGVGFIYTRYADDMSFSLKEKSTEDNISVEEGKFCVLVSKIANEEGFKINREKTRFLRKNNRQCITGIVVNNEELGVPRKWIKRFRAAIYNANKVKAEGKVPTAAVREISGMAAWLKSVNAERYKDIIDDAMAVIHGGDNTGNEM